MNIKDDEALINCMMADLKANPDFGPDEFWRGYQSYGLITAVDDGLLNFLSRPNSFGSTFTKKMIFPRVVWKINRCLRLIGIKKHPFKIHLWSSENPSNIRQRYGSLILQLVGSLPKGEMIYELKDDLVGNPTEIVSNGERQYSLNFLDYFYRALIMEEHMSLSSSRYFLEIGGGYGGQADVLLKMFPQLKICLIDIPPQLYFSEQYLKAIFPGEVRGYQETRERKVIDQAYLSQKRITILAPWQIKCIEDDAFDNFTNQASFQEMSHPTVKRYCELLGRTVKKGLCLFEQREGNGGVNEPVIGKDYVAYLTRFQLTKTLTPIWGTYLRNDPKANVAHSDIYVFKKAVS